MTKGKWQQAIQGMLDAPMPPTVDPFSLDFNRYAEQLVTEQQWLSSTDPVQMHTFLRGRGLLSELKRFAFVRDSLATPTPTSSAALTRDIWGNPFKPMWVRRSTFEQLPVTKAPISTLPGALVVESMTSVRVEILEDSWLTWNDGTIPKLARAIRGGERCEICEGPGDVRHEIQSCPACRNTGKTSPDWSLMPIMADALEESGCQNEEILMHCRGMERCPNCLGLPSPITAIDMRSGIPRVISCVSRQCENGLIPLRGPHVAGCWVLDLILSPASATSSTSPR